MKFLSAILCNGGGMLLRKKTLNYRIMALLISFWGGGAPWAADLEQKTLLSPDASLISTSLIVVHSDLQSSHIPELEGTSSQKEKSLNGSDERIAIEHLTSLQEAVVPSNVLVGEGGDAISDNSKTPSLVDLSLEHLSLAATSLETEGVALEKFKSFKRTLLNDISLDSQIVDEKEKEKPNQQVEQKGILSYRADIDLNQINPHDLLSLISLHYRLGIPLQIDTSKVEQWYREKCMAEIEYCLQNVIPHSVGKRLRVLCIDGGGVRGIYAATILREIERRTGQPICKLFDVIVATSTGAILAAGLTFPSEKDQTQPAYSAQDLVDMYMNKSSFIFSLLLHYRFLGLYGPKYDAGPLMSLLKERFHDKTLKDLISDVNFTAYSLNEKTGHVFSADEARLHADKNEFIYNVLRASTAAPTIFNPVQLFNKILCDGGVFFNNPVMLGILTGIKKHGKQLHEMDVVSVGTGYSNEVKDLKSYESFSKLSWADELMNAFLNGNNQHFLVEDLLKAAGQSHGSKGGLTYKRFTVGISEAKNLEIDNYTPENLKYLVELAEKQIKLLDADFEMVAKILTTH
jgi:uncharacterized protein